MTALYQEHFGLAKQPFQITPDTDYFFSGSQRGETLNALLHVAAHEEGIVTVVAEVGSGKTVLARRLLNELPDDIGSVYLANPCFDRTEILGAIAHDLGLTDLPTSIEELLSRLQQELLRRHANGERVLLVIDEAHAMPAESLEEVRLLSNLETGQHKLVNIMLFGQPELDTLLADPRLRQVRDRVIHRFELTPFSPAEGAAYIEHRLRIAGWQGDVKLFTDAAVAALVKAAGGRARRINLLADKALYAAYNESFKQVVKRHVREACADLPAAAPGGARRSWFAFGQGMPRLSLAGSLATVALAGTAVWAYTWQQLSTPAAALVPPAMARAAETPAATTPSVPPAETATTATNTASAPTPKTHTAATDSGKADAKGHVTQSARAPVAAQVAQQTAKADAPQALQAPRAPQVPVRAAAARPHSEPLKVAAASTSATAPTPALKLTEELASVQRIVPFAVSKTMLGPNGRKALAEIVPLAKQAERVNVRGRTDSSGSAEENRKLAKARATSVLFAFVAEGVPRKTLKATYCTTCFIAGNDTADGRKTNRRVDIELVMPAKLALHLPKPVYSAPGADEGPVLLARLDDKFTSLGQRN